MADPDGISWRSFDGLDLFARDYRADGEVSRLPVVCLHGLTRNSRDFEDLAPILALDGRRVIVPDIRGRGRSGRSPDPRRYHPATYARDVAGLLDHLRLPQAIFIGTSMGGLIMMALAARRSRAIAAAVLNDVGPQIDPRGIARILSYAGGAGPVATWAEAAAYARSTNAVAFPGHGDGEWLAFARRLFREDGGAIVPDYDPAIATGLAKPPSKLTRIAAWLAFRRLARGRPTLVVRGALSDVLTADIAERMRKAAPNIAEAVVPGVGHAPMLTEPAALDAVRSFLASQP
ncbi:MAG TPA: alpha/beta hydrolase [Sphingomicrobium sp.]|nr:alpha/beta hydrolase [Sphingomicrobium sp.]